MSLDWIVLGTGMMGKIVSPILRQAGGEIVAVAGSSVEKAQAFVKETRLPHVKVFGTLSDYEHLFELGNAVAVLTPNYLHIPQAFNAVKAGKHVLVEKPLGVTLQECYTFRDAAIEAGVAVEVNSQYRHAEVLDVLRTRIQKTISGEEVLLTMKYIQDWQRDPAQAIGWRPDVAVAGKGKLTGDLGVHVLQTTLDLFGGRFEKFDGQTYNVHPARYKFKGNVESFGGKAVPSFDEKSELYDTIDMLSPEYSGDDLATARFILESDRGARVKGRYALSQVTPGHLNNFTIDVLFENGDRYCWAEENPNHLDYENEFEFGARRKIPRASAPSISGRPGGHTKGYAEMILDEVLKQQTVIESGETSRIQAYTRRNVEQAVHSMEMIKKWNEKPLLPYHAWVGGNT